MVGFNPQSDINLLKYDYIFAGAASGFITRLLCQPFDVVKIRFQLQIEPISAKSKTSKYTGLLQTFKTIIREEGVFSLWKGHWPGQYLSVVYGCIQFTVYEYSTRFLYEVLNDPVNKKYKIAFFSGSFAGLAASFASLPFDRVRTKLVAQNEPKILTSTYQILKLIYKNQGFKGFFYGTTPTFAQTIPYTGFNFAFYRFFNEIWMLVDSSTFYNPNFAQSLVCGGFAGFVSKLIIYPFDLIKKRLQMQGFHFIRRNLGQNAHCKGFFDCIVQIIKNESLFGFYKGLYPSLLKALLTSAFHFTFYEQTIQLLSYNR